MTKVLCLFLICSIWTLAHSQQRVRHYDFFVQTLPTDLFQFSDKNLTQTPWQAMYRWHNETLTLGDTAITPQVLLDLDQRNSAEFLNSQQQIRFNVFNRIKVDVSDKPCLKNEFLINGVPVAAVGSIALSQNQKTEIQFCAAGQKKYKLTYGYFDRIDMDFDVNNQIVKQFDYSQMNQFKTSGAFMDKTFPLDWPQSRIQITVPPMVQLHTDDLNVAWRRFILKWPTSFMRPDLKTKKKLSTYSDHIFTELVNNQKIKFQNIPEGSSVYEYVDNTGHIWNTSVYRSSNTEAGFRLSGLLSSSGSIVFVGDALLSHFFENEFGFDWGGWATHRFGVKVRGFGTVAELDGLRSKTPDNLILTSSEIRINATQGLWNLDEIYGFSAGALQISWAGASANYYSAGFYAGRSMPQVLDQVLNFIPWFRSQKYIDADFAYLIPQKSDLQTGYIGNVHSKLFVNKDFYLEFGVGFFSVSSTKKSSLNTQLGTFGIGILL